MLNLDNETIYLILLSAITLAIIVRFFVKKFKKDNSITIVVSDCSGCPFKNTLVDGGNNNLNKYYCNLKRAVAIPNISTHFPSEMKKTCPIKGKLEINVSKE